MNHVKSLIRLIDDGLATQLMLLDGSLIRRFQPHDILVRGSAQAPVVVVVRGLVSGDGAAPEVRTVPLRDVGGVFSERPRQTFAANWSFFERNPVPRGWTRIHGRALEPKAEGSSLP